MSSITSVVAREILDSRGFPTVQCDVILADGSHGRASVPSGASTGCREALELRDGDIHRYHGRGVLGAVRAVNEVCAPALHGMCASDQQAVDQCLINLDGTHNKSHLGANGLLAISLAVKVAYAEHQQQPLCQSLMLEAGLAKLPVPMVNIINGGAHADNAINIQEFMILPVGASDFTEAMMMVADVFYCLKAVLQRKGLHANVGDEGGFAPQLRSNQEAIECILQAIADSDVSTKEMPIGLDVASSEIYKNQQYCFTSEQKSRSSDEMIEYLASFCQQYPIVSIEDGMSEDDWEGWQALTKRLGASVQLVGDDLFVTHASMLQRGVDENAANAILVKPNQVGTLSETMETLDLAQRAGFNAVVSHRSGETEDTFIADLAVGCGCGQIKTGSLCRGERIAKYNRLLEIEASCGFPYAGKNIFT